MTDFDESNQGKLWVYKSKYTGNENVITERARSEYTIVSMNGACYSIFELEEAESKNI